MLLRWIGGGALALLAIALFASHPLFKRYRIPSESMEPTIAHGDKVNLDGGPDVHVGDIVVFHPPQGAAAFDVQCGNTPAAGEPCAMPADASATVQFIKRIVAGPGDKVAFEDGHTILNGERQAEPFTMPCGGGEACDFPRAITVPDGMYYMLGDNRGASDDSRFWGPVRKDWILGRVARCKAVYFFCSPA